MNNSGTIRVSCFSFVLCALLMLVFGSCATVPESVESEGTSESAVSGASEGSAANSASNNVASGDAILTLVEVEDYKVSLGADGNFEYAISDSGDPFKVSIELKGVRQGEFKDTIKSNKEGIREVAFMTKMLPETATAVDITLAAPFVPVHEKIGNTLVLTFREAGSAQGKDTRKEDIWKDSKDDKNSDNKNSDDKNSDDKNSIEELTKGRARASEDGTMPKATAVTSVQFKKEVDSLQFKIVGNGALVPETYKSGDKLMIDMPNVTLKAEIPKAIEHPVKTIHWKQDGAKLRMVLELEKNAGHVVSYVNDMVLVTLTSDELALGAIEHVKSGDANEGTTPVKITEKEVEPKKEQPEGEGIAKGFEDVATPKTTQSKTTGDSGLKTGSVISPEVSKVEKVETAPKSSDSGQGFDYATAGVTRKLSESLSELSESEREDLAALSSDEGMCRNGRIMPITCGGSLGKLNLDFQGADIVPIFNLLSDVSKCNIVVNPEDGSIKGKKITMKVTDSTWYQVANIMLKTHNLACKQEGNIILIIPFETFRKEMADKSQYIKAVLEEEQDKSRIAKEKKYRKELEMIASGSVIRIFKINYAKAEEIKSVLMGIGSSGEKPGAKGAMMESGTDSGVASDSPALNAMAQARATAQRQMGLNAEQGEGSGTGTETLSGTTLLSPFGVVNIDKRTNSLIIKDVPEVMPRVEELIAVLDKPVFQVLIEARIVEISKGSEQTLGIDWGLFTQSYDKTKALLTSFGGLTGSSYLPNFPSAVGTIQSGMALGLMNKQRTMGIDLKLNAIESTGNGRILTAPKILTEDNVAATISQGVNEPYLVINDNGIGSAAFKNIVARISVTPHITHDDYVSMNVDISKEDVTEYREIAGSSTPVTSTLSENTKVSIKDGETLVLGGLFRTKESLGIEGVAGLKNIPVLGWLFKTQKDKADTSEYLIFITPRIIKRDTVIN
ncbi:MAG: type IV pilus secretin PilQ [Candidatus Magnetoovum sp. WYHC-5]|nr:type IV pilus secretin PilQ [Candidatus Magnetoovum sp. WYHC-5]